MYFLGTPSARTVSLLSFEIRPLCKILLEEILHCYKKVGKLSGYMIAKVPFRFCLVIGIVQLVAGAWLAVILSRRQASYRNGEAGCKPSREQGGL